MKTVTNVIEKDRQKEHTKKTAIVSDGIASHFFKLSVFLEDPSSFYHIFLLLIHFQPKRGIYIREIIVNLLFIVKW